MRAGIIGFGNYILRDPISGRLLIGGLCICQRRESKTLGTWCGMGAVVCQCVSVADIGLKNLAGGMAGRSRYPSFQDKPNLHE